MKKNKLKSVDPCCPLCTKPFICPILLPCAHTFCKDCVTVFVETSDGKRFSCPVCSTNISLMGSDEELFCPNFIILKTIESDECDSNLCSVCDLNQEARYFCEECSDLLCHECKERHRVVKNTKKHEVKRITSDTDIPNAVKKRYFCSEHEKEQLLLHCLHCQQSVCRECALMSHYGDKHNCIPIAEAAKRYREVLRRNLYSLKSRSPNLQLSLMDVKRIKKSLKDQVRSVRKEVGESIKRILKNIKEKEQGLYQNLVQAYRIKAKSLNKHRDLILIELEQFEAASRLLQQLELHENNVEMLQMKTTIDKALANLEKPSYELNLEQETLMFKSSEKEILAAIDRHGEIFRFCDKHKKETLNEMFGKNMVTNNSAKENSYIIICDFNEALFSSVCSFKDGPGDISNDRRDRARTHWRILQLRLNEIIEGCKNANPQNPQINDSVNSNRDFHINGVGKCTDISLKLSNQFSINTSNTKDVKNIKINKFLIETNSLEMQYKTERAYSNWLLVQSKIYDIIDYGRMKGLISFNSRNILPKSNRRRENRFILKVRQYRAKTMRARVNWKLLISKVNYENHKARHPLTKSFLEDYRKDIIHAKNKAAGNKTMAGKVRASANWLLVKARIRDIISVERHTTSINVYTPNKTIQRTNSIKTKVTPTSSGRSIKSGLALTSSKSVKYNSNQKLGNKKPEVNKKQIFEAMNPAKLEQLSSSLDRLSFETFDVNNEIKQKSFFFLNQSKSSSCLNTDSLKNWNSLIKTNVSNEYSESSPLKINKKLSKSMLNVSETSKNLTPSSNWDLLIKNSKSNEFLEITPIKTSAKPPKVKSKIPRPKRYSSESIEKEHNKNTINQPKKPDNIVTLKNNGQSNIPISSKPKNYVRAKDKISASAPNLSSSSCDDNLALENWINLVEKADASALLADKEAFENWKRFFNSSKKANSILSESKEKEALKNWDEFLKDAPSKDAQSKNILTKGFNEIEKTHTKNYISSNKINNLEMGDDTQSFLYWEKLIEGKIIQDNPSPNQKLNLGENFTEPVNTDYRLKSPSASTGSIKSKSSSVYKFLKQRITSRKSLNNKEDTTDNVTHNKDGRIITMNVKDSDNVFQELQVKLTSPDASILSTHVTKNSDGTLTVYCCPSIDNDFSMVVTINCEQFTKQHQVLNMHGSFATMKKKERDLACKTISLFRWHLTPGLLTKRGNKVIARVVRKA